MNVCLACYSNSMCGRSFLTIFWASHLEFKAAHDGIEKCFSKLSVKLIRFHKFWVKLLYKIESLCICFEYILKTCLHVRIPCEMGYLCAFGYATSSFDGSQVQS